MSTREFYVYMLIDPRTSLPFYVGKGTKTRWQDHLKETIDTTSNPYKFHKIEEIRRSGFEPAVEFHLFTDHETLAYEEEARLIRELGRKRFEEWGVLTNLCSDSRPPNRKGMKESTESKKRKSDAMRGKPKGPMSEDTKQKLSIALSGKTYKNRKSSVLSEEHKAKVSESMKAVVDKEEKTCPYCGKTGFGIAMRRWHFSNCKEKRG